MSAVKSNQLFSFRAFDAFLTWWRGNPGNSRRPDLVLAIALLLICGAAIYIGAPPALKNADDYSQFFDGGWRVVNGQRPHVDFYSPFGAIFYLPTALGMLLSHNARALGYANAAVGLVVGVWAYGIARRRLHAPVSILAALGLTLLAIAPYSLGDLPWVSSYAMIYNRQGYALLSILLIEAYVPGDEFTGGLSSGVVCGMLFFLKPTYFMMAVAILAVSLVFRRWSQRRFLGLAGGFGALLLVMLWYLRFDVGALLGDLKLVAAARATGLRLNKVAVATSLFSLVSLIVCAILVPLTSDSESEPRRWLATYRQLIFACVVSVAGVMLLLTNWQQSGLPLNATFAILLAGEIPLARLSLASEYWRRMFAGAVLVLTLMVALPPIASDALGFASAIWKTHPGISMFHARPLANFTVPPEGATARLVDYDAYVNDGIDLLRTASDPHETVANLDFSNPFSYALHRPPFRGGCGAMQYAFSFSDEHTPSPEWLIGGADLVMVPKYPTIPLEPLMRIYRDFLHKHFRLQGESARWFLYRRITTRP